MLPLGGTESLRVNRIDDWVGAARSEIPDMALLEEELTHSVIGAFFTVHRALGFGFLEHVYARALQHELRRRGHRVAREVAAIIRYDGVVIARQRVDMVVDDRLIVEIKSTERLSRGFARQLYNYLRATTYEVGLFLHFGRSADFYRVVCTNAHTSRARVAGARLAAARSVDQVSRTGGGAIDPMTNVTTERVRQDWESQADQWFAQRESLFAASRPVHEWMVDHLQPREGQRILEVAAGPGDTGFLAASRLGETGRLVSTDLSPAMVDAARKRGAELGIENAEYRVLDAQAMDLPDESVDGILCRWAVMLMPDPAAALRECRRVLRPGGRLVFAVFTGPEENPFASLPARVLIERGHLPRPGSGWTPGILALGDRDRLQSLLDQSGFGSTSVEAVGMVWPFADTDAFWRFLIELTALGPLIRSLPDDERRAVRGAIDHGLERYRSGDGIMVPARCWCGVAVR